MKNFKKMQKNELTPCDQQVMLQYLESIFKMSSKKANASHHQTKVFLDTGLETEVGFKNNSQINDISLLSKKQEKLKKDLVFWNSMAEGKLESISSCVNLFVLLLILTLGSAAYNGQGTRGPQVLGWICVSQVCFFYAVLVYVKIMLIPGIEADLQRNSTEGFKLYYTIEIQKKDIRTLELSQLELLQSIITSKVDLFVKCFPHSIPESVLNQIRTVLNSRSSKPYQINKELKELKLREKKAKWWQTFWQVFILGKTFTLPGVVLLVLIITPLSIATQSLTSKSTNNAQGWIAVAFQATGIAAFLLIKFFLWDWLNEKVENCKCDLLQAYHAVYLKHKDLNSFSLAQLQGLKGLLTKRQDDFKACFPEDNPNEVMGEVMRLINQRLPNKGDHNQQIQLKEIIENQKKMQSLSAAWHAFFSQRLITSIINILKFLIVIAITFVPNYSATATDKKNGRIVVGSIGLACFVFGYLLYLYLRAYYLNYLEQKVQDARSSPFTTFRSVYFGSKKLIDLQVHEIEDVGKGFDRRKDSFLKCFPSIDPQTFDKELHIVFKEKVEHHYETADLAHDLLRKQQQTRKMVTFWTGYVDNPLMTSMYSVYVLLVLLVVTIAENHDGAPKVLGWIGVGAIAFLITLILAFKAFIIDYKTSSLKALHVEGYSQFNLVYSKSKQLNSLQLHQLLKIQKIIEKNPIEFRKCFPKAQLNTTMDEIKSIIAQKQHQLSQSKVRSSVEQVRYQLLTLEMNRCKNALSAWTNLIMEKIYAITQLAIVVNILWVQSIATTLYGLTVCGFLTVGGLAVIAFLITFFNCYYRGHLEGEIEACKWEMKLLDRKEHSIISVSV